MRNRQNNVIFNFGWTIFSPYFKSRKLLKRIHSCYFKFFFTLKRIYSLMKVRLLTVYIIREPIYIITCLNQHWISSPYVFYSFSHYYHVRSLAYEVIECILSLASLPCIMRGIVSVINCSDIWLPFLIFAWIPLKWYIYGNFLQAGTDL